MGKTKQAGLKREIARMKKNLWRRREVTGGMWGQYVLNETGWQAKKGGKLEVKIVNVYMGKKWEEASEMGAGAGL